MDMTQKNSDYDAIIIGSGTSGATIARELSKQNKKVLIIERGGDVALKENFKTIAAIADTVKLGDGGLAAARAITTGGSTSLYFGVVSYPNLATFGALGIDLSGELDAVKRELPIASLPEELLGEKSRSLRDAAVARGHTWHKRDMLVDLAQCSGGYSYASKWKAKSYLNEALDNGAVLVSQATVSRVIVDNGQAVGVEYTTRKRLGSKQVHRVYGTKIILAAGELASPKILRDSGVKGIAERGFFCTPGHAIYGLVPGMKGKDCFVSSMGCDDYDGDIGLGDANMSAQFHRLMMLGGFKPRHLFSFSQCVGIGVKVNDGLGGTLDQDGRFYKQFDPGVHDKLRKGKLEAIRILEKVGARHIVDFGLSVAGRVGGMVRIDEHLDANLETGFRNLHVCDGSVIPDDMKGPPTVTLVCLGKYLSKRLLAQI
jgi:hypothetical protein